MTDNYEWYGTAECNDSLVQGDFVVSCPAIAPIELTESNDSKIRIRNYDAIILSQSCDLEYGKLNQVLVCPVFPLKQLIEETGHFQSRGDKDALKRGDVVGFSLLNKCEIEGFERDYSVVNFRSVFTVDFNYLCDFVRKSKKRLRLLPPYRERLSQAFARFVMRVGLPVDIPKDYYQ